LVVAVVAEEENFEAAWGGFRDGGCGAQCEDDESDEAVEDHGLRSLLMPEDSTKALRKYHQPHIRDAPGGEGSNGGFGFEDADVGEVAVAAFVVEAVADDEFIADFEADVIGVHFFGALFVFGEEDAGVDGGCAFFEEALGDGVEGAAGIEDVI
jgi:hypothetical protein